MNPHCDFCLVKFAPNELKNVCIMMIDRNPGYIHFKQVLKVCFGLAVEANFICPACFDSVMSHYTFREKVFKNLKLSTEGSDPIQSEVKKFINKLSEPANVVIYQDVLSIVPNSLKRRYDSRNLLHETLCPSVQVEVQDIVDLKKKLKEEIKSQQIASVPAVSEGIFGDDDFYVTNQLLNNASNGPSTSGISLKRKSSAPAGKNLKKMPKMGNSALYDDEALDTSETEKEAEEFSIKKEENNLTSSESDPNYSPQRRKRTRTSHGNSSRLGSFDCDMGELVECNLAEKQGHASTDDDDEQFIAIPPDRQVLRSVSSTSSIQASHCSSSRVENHVKSEQNSSDASSTARGDSRNISQWALRGALISKDNPLLTTLDEVEAFFRESFANDRILPDVLDSIMEATSVSNLGTLPVVRFLRKIVEIIFDKSVIKRVQYKCYYPECITIEGKPMKNLLREIWRLLHGQSNNKEINDVLIRDAIKSFKKKVRGQNRRIQVQHIINEHSY